MAIKIPEELLPQQRYYACGPTLLPPDRILAYAKTGLPGQSHRQGGAKKLGQQFPELLREVFNVPKEYAVALTVGGATLVANAIMCSYKIERSAHVGLGEFSNRWAKWMAAYGEVVKCEAELGSSADRQKINTSGLTLLWDILNETSTGVALPPGYQPPRGSHLNVCDATSGLGAVPINVSDWDIIFFSPQKGLAAEGGIGIAFVSPKAKEKLNEKPKFPVPPMLDLRTYLENGEKGQTFNTWPVSAVYYATEQLKAIKAEGLDNTLKRCREMAGVLYDWAEQSSYAKPLVADKAVRSTSTVTIKMDRAEEIAKILSENGVQGAAGYRNLPIPNLRVWTGPQMEMDSIRTLTKAVDYVKQNL